MLDIHAYRDAISEHCVIGICSTNNCHYPYCVKQGRDWEVATVADRKTGLVKFFDSKRGFGFIKPDDGSRDVFVSINKLPKEARGLMPDQRCSFVIADDNKKGPYAKDFSLL